MGTDELAAIRHAAWPVRNARSCARLARARAFAELARVLALVLASSSDAEALVRELVVALLDDYAPRPHWLEELELEDLRLRRRAGGAGGERQEHDHADEEADG